MHAFLVAAIFTTYMGSMAGLIAYACWTGREPGTSGQERTQEDRDPGPAVLARSSVTREALAVS